MRRGEERAHRALPAVAWGAALLVLLLVAARAFASGPSHAERTRLAIHASAYSVGEHYRMTHALPASLAQVRQRRRASDMTRDGWGHPLVFEKDGVSTFRVTSLGADGVAGGSGDDADVEVRFEIGPTGREVEVP